MPGVSFIFVGKMKEAHFAGAFADRRNGEGEGVEVDFSPDWTNVH